MRFKLYSRRAIVAYAFDDEGTVGLRRRGGLGLLHTMDGIPHAVVKRSDVADVAVILACIVEDLDREACRGRGVEVNV